MKVRILDQGFAGYTGTFGHVEFVDGVSVDISAADAERLGCILPVETVEVDGQESRNPSATQRLVETRGDRAPVEEREGRHGRRQTQDEAVVIEETREAVVVERPAPAKPLSFDYTREQLEQLADSQGIAGLRAFAAPYGINSRSIKEMIDALVEAQTLAALKAQALTQE